MRRKTGTIVLAAILSVLLITILILQVKIEDIISTITKIEPLYILLAFGLYSCGCIFRALRFKVLLAHKIKFKDLFPVVCVHNMVNNIMPARTGEVSYIYLLKRYNRETGEGIATLAVARVFDLITISLFFFISALAIQSLPEMILNILWTIAGFFVIVVVLLIVSVYFGEKFPRLLERTFIKLRVNKFSITSYLLSKFKETEKSIRVVRSKKVIFYSFLFSVLIWSSMYSMVYVLLHGMELNVILWVVVAGVTLVILLNLLPVQGVGKFGTYEGIWAVTFMLLGLKKEVAITSGFSVHIITVVFFLILGGYGLVMLKYRNSG